MSQEPNSRNGHPAHRVTGGPARPRFTVRRAWWCLGAAALAAATIAACGGGGGGSSSGGSPPVDATPDAIADSTTSAYGVLSTSNARVAFVPAPGGVTPVLLEAVGNRAITWGGATSVGGLPPTVVIPNNLDVASCTVDSGATRAVCLDYNFGTVALLDLKEFIQTLDVQDVGVALFDSGVGTVPDKYSGAECIVCGVSADAGRNRFVVGGSGGFRIFNYGGSTPIGTYNVQVGENFAMLPLAGGTTYIVAPEYEPRGGSRKLRVIDIDSGRAYVWDKNTDSIADLGPDGVNVVASEIDAAAVDLESKMIVMSTESSADFLLVDLGNAVFDDVNLTFSAPHMIARTAPGNVVERMTDVAVSATGSILVTHGEATAFVGVLQLPTSLAGGAPGGPGIGTFDLNDPALDRSGCGGPGYRFFGKGDPHGLSLYLDLSKATQGLVIDQGNDCAALLDMARLATAPRMASNSNLIDMAAPGVRDMIEFKRLR